MKHFTPDWVYIVFWLSLAFMFFAIGINNLRK